MLQSAISPRRALLAALALSTSACGSGSLTTTAAAAPGQAQVVTVAVSPGTTTAAPGSQQHFTAAVTGTANTAVTWSVEEGPPGGLVTTAGDYTAPGQAGAYHVRATSAADDTKFGDAAVTVTGPPPPPVTVVVTPSPGAVLACQTLTLSATVTGGSGSRAVTWSAPDVNGGTVGASTGVYTAPSSAGSYRVVATSVADPSRSATALVNVTTKVLSVAVDPPTLQVPTSGTAQFTATVTTTCGSATALQLINSSGVVRSAN